jgi:hypothetical protein
VRVAGYGSSDFGFGIADFGLKRLQKLRGAGCALHVTGCALRGAGCGVRGIGHSVKADKSDISENSNALPSALCALPLNPHSAFQLPNSNHSAMIAAGHR